CSITSACSSWPLRIATSARPYSGMALAAMDSTAGSCGTGGICTASLSATSPAASRSAAYLDTCFSPLPSSPVSTGLLAQPARASNIAADVAASRRRSVNDVDIVFHLFGFRVTTRQQLCQFGEALFDPLVIDVVFDQVGVGNQ